jgi:hypothetical protein
MIKISEIKNNIRLNVSKRFNKNRSGRELQHVRLWYILEKKATAVTKAMAPLKNALIPYLKEINHIVIDLMRKDIDKLT